MTTETTTTSNRPASAKTRQKGAMARVRFTRGLRQSAIRVLGYQPTTNALNRWAAQRHKATGTSNIAAWANMRTRPEVVATVAILQERHLTNTGKEVSQSEVVCALIATGLPHIINNPAFADNLTN